VWTSRARAQSLKYIPLGAAYAIWSGLGTRGSVLLGLLIWKEILGSVHIFGIALIVGAWRCSTSPSSRSYSPECVEGKFCEVELPLYGVL